MTTVHLVHGFNVSDSGRATTDRLAPYFRDKGFATRQWDYGWVGLVGVRFANPRVAARLAAAVEPGDIAVGHSNGACIVMDAADLGAPLDGLILLNPAVECDRKAAGQVKWWHVYYNSADGPVEASELLDWLPWNGRLWGKEHFWGNMGNRGFTGSDDRCRKFDCSIYEPPIAGHSTIFRRLDRWGERIVNLAGIDHMRYRGPRVVTA